MHYPTQLPTIPLDQWFNVNSLDRDNLQAHLEQTAQQEATLNAYITHYEKAYLDAKDLREKAEAEAFIRFKLDTVEQITSKGPKAINVSDELAKMLVVNDDHCHRLRVREAEAKYLRDYWKGLRPAFTTKKSFLACLSGLTREEMRMYQQG